MSILKFQILSIIFIIIVGSLLHFTYQLSGNNPLVATFSAVNESVWEHLKLAFFPMLITTIIGYFVFKDTIPNFLCAKTLSMIFAILFIPIFFYTYTNILGTHNLFLDILSFILAVIIGESLAYFYIIYGLPCNTSLSIFTIISLLLCFIIFTFAPPHLPIFQEESTGIYGVSKFKIQSYLFNIKS